MLVLSGKDPQILTLVPWVEPHLRHNRCNGATLTQVSRSGGKARQAHTCPAVLHPHTTNWCSYATQQFNAYLPSWT
jgi:hypothetical protein